MNSASTVHTAKNITEIDISVISKFLNIAKLLSDNQLLYWARSQDTFFEFMNREKLAIREPLPIDKDFRKSVTGFVDMFIGVWSCMTEEQKIFWSEKVTTIRDFVLSEKAEELLSSKLSTGFQIWTEDQCSTESSVDHGGRSPFRNSLFEKSIIKRSELPEQYHATSETNGMYWSALCPISYAEIIDSVGGEEVLRESCFSLPQIRTLATRQRTLGLSGPLDFHRTNYFPVIGKNGQILFFELSWAPIFRSKTDNQWFQILWKTCDDRGIREHGSKLFLVTP